MNNWYYIEDGICLKNDNYSNCFKNKENAKKQIKDNTNLVKKIKKQIEDAADTNEDNEPKKELKTAETELETDKTELETAKAKLETAKAELETAEKKLKTAEKKLEKAETESEKTEAKSEKGEAKSEKDKAELKIAEAELKTAEIELKTAEKELKTAEKKLEKAETESEKTKAESEKTKAELKKAEAELKKDKAELKIAEIELTYFENDFKNFINHKESKVTDENRESYNKLVNTEILILKKLEDVCTQDIRLKVSIKSVSEIIDNNISLKDSGYVGCNLMQLVPDLKKIINKGIFFEDIDAYQIKELIRENFNKIPMIEDGNKEEIDILYEMFCGLIAKIENDKTEQEQSKEKDDCYYIKISEFDKEIKSIDSNLTAKEVRSAFAKYGYTLHNKARTDFIIKDDNNKTIRVIAFDKNKVIAAKEAATEKAAAEKAAEDKDNKEQQVDNVTIDGGSDGK